MEHHDCRQRFSSWGRTSETVEVSETVATFGRGRRPLRARPTGLGAGAAGPLMTRP
jgi:hypothetical protein